MLRNETLTVLELARIQLVRRLGPGARQLVGVRLALVALLLVVLLLPGRGSLSPPGGHALDRVRGVRGGRRGTRAALGHRVLVVHEAVEQGVGRVRVAVASQGSQTAQAAPACLRKLERSVRRDILRRLCKPNEFAYLSTTASCKIFGGGSEKVGSCRRDGVGRVEKVTWYLVLRPSIARLERDLVDSRIVPFPLGLGVLLVLLGLFHGPLHPVPRIPCQTKNNRTL